VLEAEGRAAGLPSEIDDPVAGALDLPDRDDRVPTGQRGPLDVIDADHGQAAGADDEPVEGLPQRLEAAVVGVVVGLDVGDHGDLGAELDEGAVALVGLDHEPLAVGPHGAGADLVDVPADDEAGVEAGFGEDHGQHRGGRRLAVGAGDGDRAPECGDGRQDLRSAQHRQALLPGGDDLGVARTDGGGDGHDLGVAQLVGPVTHRDPHALVGQTVEGLGGLEVAATHPVAHRGQDAGDGAHARATDPDDVDRLRRGEVDDGVGGGPGVSHGRAPRRGRPPGQRHQDGRGRGRRRPSPPAARRR